MNRLLVGDVGTGKTVLAVLAAAAARAAGRTTALLAPTELLAEQHFATLRKLATPLGLRSAYVSGATPPRERHMLARALEHGDVSVVVGTHALLSESVELPRLGLAVIDEQHRFGVAQRRALATKGESPHLLAMSATPIPRSLALTVFGDLDHSTLREKPAGPRADRDPGGRADRGPRGDAGRERHAAPRRADLRGLPAGRGVREGRPEGRHATASSACARRCPACRPRSSTAGSTATCARRR